MPPTSTSRIQLNFYQTLDLDLFDKGVEVWVRRTMVLVQFKTKAGWNGPFEAIVDTGSPLSVVPAGIWKDIEKKALCSDHITGIVPGASMPTHVAEITAMFADKSHNSSPMHFKANLAEDDRVPLLIGFEGILSKTILHMEPQKSQGYIEFP